MALRKAALPIQFAGGLDTRTDPKQVQAPKLLNLENAVFTRQTTISKRNGYRALSTAIQDAGGDITNARGLGRRDDEVLLFTDKRCYSSRPSSDTWADTGEVAATTLTTRPIARTGTFQTQPDIAERNGVRVVAWEDSRGGVWCSVLESATGRQLQSQRQLDSAALARNPRCLAVGEVLHVLWTREDLGNIQVAIVQPASPATAPVVSTLTSDLDGTKPFYDAAVASSQGVSRPAILAWAQAGGGFRVGYIHPSGVLGSPVTSLPSVATYPDTLGGPIAVSWDALSVIVAVSWIAAATIGLRVLDGTNLTFNVRSPGTLGGGGTYSRIAIAHGATGSDSFRLLYWAAEVSAARSDLSAVDSGSALASASTLDATSTRLRGHGLVSRAWRDGATLSPAARDGDVYVLVAHTARFFPYVAALRLSGPSIAAPNAVIVSRVLPGEAAGSLMRVTGAGTRAWTQHLPSVLEIDVADTDVVSRTHAICVPYRVQLSSQNGDQFSEQGLKLAVISMLPSYLSVQLGRGLYLSSSAPMHYDGEQWREADFHCAPDIGYDTTGTPVDMGTTCISMVAGGNIANGTYIYRYWYEAVDAQGELHRGPTSAPMLVTMTGGPRSFSHTIPTCRLTRFANVRLCVARSQQGATGANSAIPLYRVTSTDVTVTTGSNRYVTNDPTVDTVTFVDGLADATLTTREPLYTNGGVLSNAPAPWSGAIAAVGKGRIFFTDSTNPLLVRYSQQTTDDTALEAPIDLATDVDPFGGDITAVGVLDDTVAVFKEQSTFVFAGPGPLRNPASAPEANAFTLAERIPSDVGCISPSSVGQTAIGITFQSRKGIQLLSGNREIINIGNPVQALDGQTYSRTTLLPDRQAIVYLTDTPDGFSLLWDYNRNQWSKFSNHVGLDAIVVDDVYYYLRTDSRVFAETPGVYRDDNSNIPLKIETAWIHFADYLQGWQKILWAQFLGKYVSQHTLSVRYRLDYNDAYSPAILNNVDSNNNPSLYGAGLYGAGAYGGSGGDTARYQRRIHINRRCQSISFLIEDVEATGNFGASFELSELLLIGGGIGPDFKPGAARAA